MDAGDVIYQTAVAILHALPVRGNATSAARVATMATIMSDEARRTYQCLAHFLSGGDGE